MSYPSKSYKVHPMFRVLYSSIFDVLNRNKTTFLDYYLDKAIGKEERQRLSQFDYNDLIVEMLNQMEDALFTTNYDDFSLNIYLDRRTEMLRKAYKNTLNTPENLISTNFRISPTTIRQVTEMKHETLGNVIELAILYYAIRLPELDFELMFNVYIRNVESGKFFV